MNDPIGRADMVTTINGFPIARYELTILDYFGPWTRTYTDRAEYEQALAIETTRLETGVIDYLHTNTVSVPLVNRNGTLAPAEGNTP